MISIEEYDKVLRQIANEMTEEFGKKFRVFVNADANKQGDSNTAGFSVSVFGNFTTGHELRNIAMKLRQVTKKIDDSLATELYKRGME